MFTENKDCRSTKIINLSEVYEYNCSDQQFVEVSDDVYQLLTQDFKREEKRQEMSNYRHYAPISFDLIAACISDEGAEIENALIRELELDLLRLAIDQLEPNRQKWVKQYFYKNMTLKEISAGETVSHVTIFKNIRKAMEELRTILED